jgi:hypothetical protein
MTYNDLPTCDRCTAHVRPTPDGEHWTTGYPSHCALYCAGTWTFHTVHGAPPIGSTLPPASPENDSADRGEY